MNATVMSFHGLIDEMKTVAAGGKKPTIRSGKSSYQSKAAHAFAMKLAKKKGSTMPSAKATAAKTELDIAALAGVTRLVSRENQILLQLIAAGGVLSISDLAEKSHRAETNLSRTVKKFERMGVLKLVPGVGRAKVPMLAMKSFQVHVNVMTGKFSVLSAEESV